MPYLALMVAAVGTTAPMPVASPPLVRPRHLEAPARPDRWNDEGNLPPRELHKLARKNARPKKRRR